MFDIFSLFFTRRLPSVLSYININTKPSHKCGSVKIRLHVSCSILGDRLCCTSGAPAQNCHGTRSWPNGRAPRHMLFANVFLQVAPLILILLRIKKKGTINFWTPCFFHPVLKRWLPKSELH